MRPALVVLSLSAFLLSISCGEKKEKEEKKEEQKEAYYVPQMETTPDSKIIPTMLADISFRGIMHEVDGSNRLRNMLSAMVGVAEIRIENMSSEYPMHYAVVKYDESKVNDRQIVSAIEKWNNGSLKVEHIELKRLEEKPVTKMRKAVPDEVTRSEFRSTGTSSLAMPSIIDVFDVL